ncbi:U1-hexatoxin-Iw1e-like [Centruroides sculpturatus]|uniref:U1-hexatoxin-Iw1e-like n=1 Tax=Centruroides sculpturatus TaxID=218467 RepID=UPI000C6DF0B4|nr:U1-hexatoxin-Iw1e-like [Centruroides sculpturatus]
MFYLLLLLFIILFPSQEANSECMEDKDCGEGRCCISTYWGGICHTYGKLGDLCLPFSSIEDERHIYFCPCVEGLKCVPEEIRRKNGKVQYVNATCAHPNAKPIENGAINLKL